MNKILTLLAVFSATIGLAQTAPTIGLEWDPPTDPLVALVYIYQGTNAGNYSSLTKMARTNQYTSPFLKGLSNFWSASFVYTNGTEGPLSNEISIMAPQPTNAIPPRPSFLRFSPSAVIPPTNSPPVFLQRGSFVNVPMNGKISFNATAIDVNNDPITYSLVPLDGPYVGTISNVGNVFTYIPTAGFAGTDHVSIAATDGKGGVAATTTVFFVVK